MSESNSDQSVFHLFVVGQKMTTPKTIQGVQDALTVLLGGEGFQLRIFDVVADPRSAFENRIKATPTLIRTYPLPEVRIIGDMGNPEVFVPVLRDVGGPQKRVNFSRSE